MSDADRMAQINADVDRVRSAILEAIPVAKAKGFVIEPNRCHGRSVAGEPSCCPLYAVLVAREIADHRAVYYPFEDEDPLRTAARELCITTYDAYGFVEGFDHPAPEPNLIRNPWIQLGRELHALLLT